MISPVEVEGRCLGRRTQGSNPFLKDTALWLRLCIVSTGKVRLLAILIEGDGSLARRVSCQYRRCSCVLRFRISSACEWMSAVLG